MKYLYLILIGINLLFVSITSQSSTSVNCKVIELTIGQPEYNRLVCGGILKMRSQHYSEAVSLFEKALAIPLFETPNFELLPRLAYSYFKSNSTDKSKHTLLLAKLTLSVFSGLIKCNESKLGFQLKYSDGAIIKSKGGDEAARLMCGAAYDYIYDRRSLERVIQEAELINNYFKFEREIKKVGSGSVN